MIVIVGSGLAGTVAAARLRALGREVTVVSDRPGATAMHGGGWLLGQAALARLGWPAAALEAALASVEAGLPELALTRGPFRLLDTDGVLRTVDVAARSHTRPLPAHSAAVDLLGLGQPFAEMCSGFKPLAVEWPSWPEAFGRSFAAAAHRVDLDLGSLDVLIARLKSALVGQGVQGLLLPPVLGLTSVEASRARLEEALGLPVAEGLGTVPSTPGLRLWHGLAGWRRRMGLFDEVVGRVTRVDLAGRSVLVGDLPLPFGTLILATGGPIPGGLSTDRDVKEALVGLRTSPELPDNWQAVSRPDRPGDAPLFRVGVPVDAQFRPTRHDGSPVDSSLYAIGDLVTGSDPIADRCSSGRALVSGWLAAQAIAEGAA